MQTRLAFPNDALINFGAPDENGKLKIETLSPDALAIRVNQTFDWTDDVLVEESKSLSCYLLKLSLNKDADIGDVHSKARWLMNWVMQNVDGNVLILCNDKFYFSENLSHDCTRLYETEANKSSLPQLILKFQNIRTNTYQLADSDTLKIITSVIGSFLDINLINDTISLNKFQEKMQQVQETYHKLAIVKINDLVGYGVIVLEDIPASTTITFYSGIFRLSSQKDKNDDYALGNKQWGISAKKYRNFAGFITHAFAKKDPEDFSGSPNTVYLSHFSPCQEMEKKESAKNMASGGHENLLSANVFPKLGIFNHKPYSFFENPKTIPKGSILAWDYGLGYWSSRKLAPALLNLKGEIVDPTTYVCTNEYYIEAMKPTQSVQRVSTEATMSHYSLFNLFGLFKQNTTTNTQTNHLNRSCALI